MTSVSSEFTDAAADVAIKYVERGIGGTLDPKLKIVLIFFVKNSKEVAVFAIQYKKEGVKQGAKLLSNFLLKKGVITLELGAKLADSELLKCIAATASLAVGLPGETALAATAMGAVAALGLLLIDLGEVAESCGSLVQFGGTNAVMNVLIESANTNWSCKL